MQSTVIQHTALHWQLTNNNFNTYRTCTDTDIKLSKQIPVEIYSEFP